MDEETIDISATVAQARRAMSSYDFRRKYRYADWITYSAKQMEIMNSKAPALFVRAGNQVGKTQVGAGIVAALLTQEFPADYDGWVQPKLELARPHTCEVWCIAPTWQMVRDGCQSRLLGDVAAGQVGTGIIPADRIISIQNARGISGSVDTAIIRRTDGTTAVLRFKTGDQGREALQGSSCDMIWADEMPEMDVWGELLARLSATSGRILLTATPLKQGSDVAAWFREPGQAERRQTIVMGIDDANHLTPQMRADMLGKYANDPVAAATRLFGAEWAGGGLIFPNLHADNLENRPVSEFPMSIRWIIGLDPAHQGLSTKSAHPAGVILLAYDPLGKICHVVDEIRLQNELPSTLVAAILNWENGDAPVAWGQAETQGTGDGTRAETYAGLYKRLGLRMLDKHATLPGGGVSLDPQIDNINQLLATGKLKISRRCKMLLEELSNYERDEKGQPIPVRDDLISALRYAILMAPQYARGLEPDRVRHGMGRRRLYPGMAEGVDFDVHGNTGGDLPVGRQRGRSGPYMARGADFDPFDV